MQFGKEKIPSLNSVRRQGSPISQYGTKALLRTIRLEKTTDQTENVARASLFASYMFIIFKTAKSMPESFYSLNILSTKQQFTKPIYKKNQ